MKMSFLDTVSVEVKKVSASGDLLSVEMFESLCRSCGNETLKGSTLERQPNLHYFK